MGACSTSTVIESNTKDKVSNQDKKSQKKSDSKSNEDDIEEMINQQKEEFPDMKEWKGERYSGIGIKKMKGYKCNLPIDKLNEKREEFWGTRNSHQTPNYKTWRAINQACVYDEYRANMLLQECELTTADGCINHIIDKKGYHYIVPNYCINDPYFEKQLKVNEDMEQKNINIVLYEVSANVTLNLEVSDLLTGKELKDLFKKKANIDDSFNLRLFFSGCEIKDDHFLYQHNLKKGYKIQVMKLLNLDGKKKEENNKEDRNKSDNKAESKSGRRSSRGGNKGENTISNKNGKSPKRNNSKKKKKKKAKNKDKDSEDYKDSPDNEEDDDREKRSNSKEED